MSMSGIDLRPGLRKRSKSRSLASGSMSVIVERVGDDRAGGRAAAGADGDAVLLGVADEVPDDQEVGGEAHLLDHAELELEPLLAPRPGSGRRSGRAAPRRRCGAASPPAPRRRASGSAAAAACRARSRPRSARRSRASSAPPPATRRRRFAISSESLEVELVGVEAQLRRLQGRLGLHAEQGRVVVEVLAAQVVDVGGADQRPAQLAGEADDPLVRLVLLGDAVLLHLEVDLLGPEGLDQVVEVGAGVVGALFDQAAAEARLQAAGERDHTLGVRGEQLHVDVGLAAREALEEAGRGELDQVGEAGVALGQQGEVVALVLGLAP